MNIGNGNIVDQILWLETLLKGSIGLVMMLAPIRAARIGGLPHGNSAFWPRLFGVAMLGVAAAFALEGTAQIKSVTSAKGMGLGGAIVINFVTLLFLFGTILFKGVQTWRGRLLIWMLVLVLLALIIIEIGYV